MLLATTACRSGGKNRRTVDLGKFFPPSSHLLVPLRSLLTVCKMLEKHENNRSLNDSKRFFFFMRLDDGFAVNRCAGDAATFDKLTTVYFLFECATVSLLLSTSNFDVRL